MGYIDKLPAMDLMRSEKMTPVQLIIPVESARRAVSYLGQLGLLQFRDFLGLPQHAKSHPDPDDYNQRIFRDVPSDITIEVTGGTFALHKISGTYFYFTKDMLDHASACMLCIEGETGMGVG
ncbi:hypothetical protein RHGRI_002371 [Rhododendron griersonianum]|uniref:Uncharacterized protein n=1 Tax=Rhododendron griersonianum TaxID=479676 RepID=A0AAV6LNS4_9ERIC|nr:hypothetical protein RHGRI_002371 [Rhododendron griersonianum]